MLRPKYYDAAPYDGGADLYEAIDISISDIPDPAIVVGGYESWAPEIIGGDEGYVIESEFFADGSATTVDEDTHKFFGADDGSADNVLPEMQTVDTTQLVDNDIADCFEETGNDLSDFMVE